MSLVINTNIASLNSQRQILRSGSELDQATLRLSSGKRINSASDDAAGMAIANRMTSQVRGLQQAIRNTNDGISLLQVADGALNETSNMLQRIRELSVQASNGVYSNGDRATLNAEVKQLLSQIDFVAKTTQFNGVNLLDGSNGKIELQVGANQGQNVAFQLGATTTKSLGLTSQVGDIVGDQIQVDSDGTLTNALNSASIKINGINLQSLANTAKLTDLVKDINDNVKDVDASTVVELKATTSGNGVIQGSDSLQLTAVNLDGNSVTYTINNTSTQKELIDKINQATGGVITASADDSGHLILSSDQLAKLSAVDSTAGTATGISPGASPSTDITNILYGLNHYWISEAENKIATYFGLTGDGRNMALNLLSSAPGSDGVGGKLAFVDPNPSNFSLNLDMADFTGVSLPNGPNSGGGIYGDRIIAHEMVHAVMATNMNLGILGGWFTEGTAEFIHGADERVLGDISAHSIDTLSGFQTEWDNAQAPGSPSTSAGYSVGYVAVKMLHQFILDHGGNGIKDVMAQLAQGKTFDQALQTVASNTGITAWNNGTTFEAYVRLHGFNFMMGNADATLNTDMGGAQRVDLTGGATQTDTGSVAGSDYGNPALTATSVLPNTANQGPIHFNLVVPAQYLGGTQSANAQLVLKSKTGSDISITKGSEGKDVDLNNLGLQEMQSHSVLGDAVTQTNQALSLAANDLVINGSAISAVNGTSGLQGKVDAINSLSSTTGVTASLEAKQSYRMNIRTLTEYVGTTPTAATGSDVIGIRGIGIAISAGDSAQDVSTKINQTFSYHGAMSYVDKSGRLHIYSDQPLNLQQQTSYFTDIGLAADSTASGSLNIRGTEVALSNIDDINTVVTDVNLKEAYTGVHAAVDDNGELQFTSPNAITIRLGATNGLKTMDTLGIKVSLAASGADLNDTDADYSLTDDAVTINSRIKLQSQTNSAISVQLNSNNAELATGLKNLNAASAAATGSSLAGLDVSTASSAQKALTVVDNALSSINDTRSRIGAVNNRLDFTVANLSNIVEKTTASLSRIVDADFAGETAKLSRAQVLQLAAQSMLAQANSRPQNVLSLLRQ